MKFKPMTTATIVISSIAIGIGVLTLNELTSKGSEMDVTLNTNEVAEKIDYSKIEKPMDKDNQEVKLAVKGRDNAMFLKTSLTKEDGLSNDLSGNPFRFAKILDNNYNTVATKVRIDYTDEFFNILEQNMDYHYGLVKETISIDKWLDFYKGANAKGVEDYLNKTKEHTLIIRISGSMCVDDTIKFVNLDNLREYESIEGELHNLTKEGISQYFIEEDSKLVLVKDTYGYRKATSEERGIVLDLDEELKTSTGSKLSLKYHEDESVDDEKDLRYVLDMVEIYNKNADKIYSEENFSNQTLKLIENIKKGTIKEIKYRETGDLYNYSI